SSRVETSRAKMSLSFIGIGFWDKKAPLTTPPPSKTGVVKIHGYWQLVAGYSPWFTKGNITRCFTQAQNTMKRVIAIVSTSECGNLLRGDGRNVAQASSPAGFGGVPPPEAEE